MRDSETRAKSLPFWVELVAPPAKLSFLNCQTIDVGREVSLFQAWSVIMAQPLPALSWAFAVRDAVSAWFGVKQISGYSGAPLKQPKIGDRLDFFGIETLMDTVVTLTARDRHLDVMTCATVAGPRASVTASVIT